jgi:hypothetical protein
MPRPGTPVAAIVGRIAIESRHHPDDKAGHARLRRDLHAAKIETRIREAASAVAAGLPPLTAEQRDQLTALLDTAAEPAARRTA